jgi:hypothetical protein
MPTGQERHRLRQRQGRLRRQRDLQRDFGALAHRRQPAGARLGQADPGASRTLWLFAASLSRQLDDRWGVGRRVSPTPASKAPRTRASSSWPRATTSSKRHHVDCGAARACAAATRAGRRFTGFTWLAARVF